MALGENTLDPITLETYHMCTSIGYIHDITITISIIKLSLSIKLLHNLCISEMEQFHGKLPTVESNTASAGNKSLCQKVRKINGFATWYYATILEARKE